jgi:hypothetical protein
LACLVPLRIDARSLCEGSSVSNSAFSPPCLSLVPIENQDRGVSHLIAVRLDTDAPRSDSLAYPRLARPLLLPLRNVRPVFFLDQSGYDPPTCWKLGPRSMSPGITRARRHSTLMLDRRFSGSPAALAHSFPADRFAERLTLPSSRETKAFNTPLS